MRMRLRGLSRFFLVLVVVCCWRFGVDRTHGGAASPKHGELRGRRSIQPSCSLKLAAPGHVGSVRPPDTGLPRSDTALVQPERLNFALSVGIVVVVLGFALSCLAAAVAKRSYASIKVGNSLDLDTYVGDLSPTATSCARILFMTRMNVGYRTPCREPLKLGEAPSPFVDKLLVTSRFEAGSSTAMRDHREPPIVVGTIRMGFGHHRIGYAAASWAIASGRATYFHDLLNIESPEAQLIRDTDKLYSKLSRYATEIGGPVERMWGAATKSGDENMLRATYQMAEHLRPLLLGLPKDAPVIAAHSLVGLAAVACGFTRVINLVIDNHAQWFCIVPGALNLVQGPANYIAFLKMGVPASELRLAGHWIPKSLLDNLEDDCHQRKERLKEKAPVRLLIPVGGAGAQRKYVTSLICALGPFVKAGKVHLFLNAGDHASMIEAFGSALKSMGVAYDTVDSSDGVHDFCEQLRRSKAPRSAVTLFGFSTYFPAVATTDIVARVSDVLCCKPSELAFYPLPKLMIRRVGDHEAFSALRASELGDGTLEAREIEDAIKYVKLFEEPDLLNQMNDCILRNAALGLYNGCETAVRIACQA